MLGMSDVLRCCSGPRLLATESYFSALCLYLLCRSAPRYGCATVHVSDGELRSFYVKGGSLHSLFLSPRKSGTCFGIEKASGDLILSSGVDATVSRSHLPSRNCCLRASNGRDVIIGVPMGSGNLFARLIEGFN